MKLILGISICTLLIGAGCNEGLNPDSAVVEGFGGTITYISKIPPADSLRDLRVVAVPYYPIDTTFSSILLKVTQGIISYSPATIAAGDSGTVNHYQMVVKPGTYNYVAVVQQYGSDVFTQWKVVSVYGATHGTTAHAVVVVNNNTFIDHINFVVDFYHLPPQPFAVP